MADAQPEAAAWRQRIVAQNFFPRSAGLLALLFFAAAAFLYSRHNSFPYWYHPDEPRKARQIVQGERDFRHPLLLLTASEIALRISNLPHTKQNAVVVGRSCAALFAAAAVGALAFLAYRQRGIAALVAAGVIVLLHSQLFELAHFMKEDTALLMGFALFFVALDAFWRSPRPGRALALGLACALASSGKYVGFATVAIALPFVTVSSRSKVERGGLRHVGAFLLGCAVLLLALNWEAWIRPASWAQGFANEMIVFHREDAGGYAPPSLARLLALHDLAPPIIWLFALLYLALFAAQHRHRTAVEWLTALFPFAFAACVLVAGKESGRYYLPAAVFLSYNAALGIVDFSSYLAARFAAKRTLWFAGTVAISLLLVAATQLPDLSLRYRGFQTDHRKQLAKFVADSVPPAAIIAAEKKSGLVAFDSDIPQQATQRVIGADFVPQLGTLEQLRTQGVTHVAVDYDNMKRVGRWRLLPAHGEFYKRLASEGKLVFEVKRRPVRILNPGLRLYEIAP